jgi:hypothetical protein
MMIKRALVSAVVVSGLIAGCTTDPTPPQASPSPSTSAPSTAAASTQSPPQNTPCTPPPFTANTQPDTQAAVGGPLGMQSAAAAGHACYDRVAFTLGGNTTGQPGWRVEYVSAPTSDGSGEPVNVNGPAYLQVVIRAVGYPGDTGIPDPAVKRFSPSDTHVVHEVVLDTAYEGQYTAFIGVSATLPFRVFRLSNPARVVIDIRYS